MINVFSTPQHKAADKSDYTVLVIFQIVSFATMEWSKARWFDEIRSYLSSERLSFCIYFGPRISDTMNPECNFDVVLDKRGLLFINLLEHCRRWTSEEELILLQFIGLCRIKRNGIVVRLVQFIVLPAESIVEVLLETIR